MSEQGMSVPQAKRPVANSNVTPPRDRKPFTPPTLTEIGELRELTQQFGGSA
jgi:hypothetical protein